MKETTMKPNVLVACEVSGRVRDAFLQQGINAISCDIEPSDAPGPHIQGDIRDVDLSQYTAVVAFPPCTDLAVSGARYFAAKRADGRQQRALSLVRYLLDAPVPYVAVENPVGVISSAIRKPDQIIQPWQFGHEETKATCLWLRGLPPLVPTRVMEYRRHNLTPSGQNKLGPSPERAKLRGLTYSGIAAAMAAQWGPVINA